jgi:hypothetical protein
MCTLAATFSLRINRIFKLSGVRWVELRANHTWIRKILTGEAERIKSVGKLRHRY